MEIIRLSGYDIPEKVAIATRYLVPKALKEAGLQDAEGIPSCIIVIIFHYFCSILFAFDTSLLQ